MTARYLEAQGLPTVIVGSALDIVEHCKVPRFLFTDFPLGNPCGKPWDVPMQERIVLQALALLESASAGATTLRSEERWGDDAWRARYMAVTADNAAQLAAKGAELRARRQVRKPRQL